MIKLLTIGELLARVAPPLELVELLEKYEARQQLPAPAQTYLDLWRIVRSDAPSPLDGAQLEGMQE